MELEGVPLISSDDKRIIGRLTESELALFAQMRADVAEFGALQAAMLAKQSEIAQKHNLFWGQFMMKKHERCETIVSRSKALTVAKTEQGEAVLVELPTTQKPGPS